MSNRREEMRQRRTIDTDVQPNPIEETTEDAPEMDIFEMVDMFTDTVKVLRAELKSMGFEEEYQVQLIRTFFETWI